MRYSNTVESPVYHSGSLSFVTTFAEPAFILPYAGPRLQRAVYLALREHGMEPAGLQESKVHTGPAGWFLSASFLSFAAELKVRVDGFDVTFISEPARDIALRKQVLHAVEHAILQADPHTSPSRRIFIQQTHCKLSQQGARERIPPYTRSLPESLGTPAGQGIGLYFTSPLFSDQASVALDKSAAVDEGLFVQVRCEFGADEFDLLTSIDNFEEYLTSLEHAFDLRGILGGRA